MGLTCPTPQCSAPPPGWVCSQRSPAPGSLRGSSPRGALPGWTASSPWWWSCAGEERRRLELGLELLATLPQGHPCSCWCLVTLARSLGWFQPGSPSTHGPDVMPRSTSMLSRIPVSGIRVRENLATLTEIIWLLLDQKERCWRPAQTLRNPKTSQDLHR